MADHDAGAHARAVLDGLESPTCALDTQGVVISVNRAWRDFTAANGGAAARCGVGASYLDVCRAVPPDSPDRADAVAVGRGLRDVLGGWQERFQREYACHGDHTERWFSMRVSPLDLGGARGAVVTHVDVSAMHHVQRALTHQALHDGLTGLPNRLLLDDRLGQAVADAKRRGNLVAVALLDVDHFKQVNDDLGHAAGDDLLSQVAQRLATGTRAADTLCRYAGDEFVVLWRDLHSAQEADELGERLLTAFDEPFRLGEHVVTVTASTGLAVGHPTGDGRELLLAADAVMYAAKREGQGLLRRTDTDARPGSHSRSTSEAELGAAVERDELVVHYEPVIDLRTGAPVGAHAHLRWQHPVHGLIVPEVTSRRAAVPLGRWLLEATCRDAAALARIGVGGEVVLTALGPELEEPDAVRRVREALDASGLDPHRLVVQVPEVALAGDRDAAALAIAELTRLGVRVGLADLGAGRGPALWVRRYPLAALALDPAVVAGVADHPDDAAVCAAVIGLARASGASCLGLGVATGRQAGALLALGCHLAAGSLWSFPVPLDQLAAAVEAARAVSAPDPVVLDPVAVTVDQEVRERVLALHQAGATLRTISATLHRVGTPAPDGQPWRSTTVAHVLRAAP